MGETGLLHFVDWGKDDDDDNDVLLLTLTFRRDWRWKCVKFVSFQIDSSSCFISKCMTNKKQQMPTGMKITYVIGVHDEVSSYWGQDKADDSKGGYNMNRQNINMKKNMISHF